MLDLPKELLIEIFSYCKVLPLTHVCKEFNEIISDSSCLMKKFNLLINEKTNYQEVAQSRRKHQNILIKFNYKLEDSILDVLKVFGEQIKHLELMRCILREKLFIEMMELLPNLQTLSIYSTYLKSDYTFRIESQPINCLGSLKALNFRNSDQKFLILLKNSPAVKSINISLPQQYPPSVVTDFLEHHKNVEVIENLMISEIEQTILVRVLCSMTHLKKLCLEIDKIQMDDIKNLEIENKSIEFLNLYGSPNDPADFNTIISFFRNIKQLEIEINSILEPINMVQLTRTCKNIESLKIMNCYGDFFTHLSLPNLKTFEIFDVSSFSLDDWTAFSQRNQNIETLIIKDEAVTDDIFMTITQEFRRLKYLELFYDPQRLTNEILNYICDTLFPRNIRTVKIRKRQWQQYSSSFFTLTDNHKDILDGNLGFNLILR